MANEILDFGWLASSSSHTPPSFAGGGLYIYGLGVHGFFFNGQVKDHSHTLFLNFDNE